MAKPLKVKKLAPDDPARAAAVRVMRTRLKEFYSHWRDLDTPPDTEQLHAMRISGKRLRYSAETLRDFYADRLTLLLDLLKQIQDALGEMQDYETQLRMLEAEKERAESRLRRETAAAKRASIAGEIEMLASLIAHCRRKQEKSFVEFAHLWRGLSDKRLRAGLKHLVSRPLE